MKPQFQAWHLLLLILAGWINRRQQDAVEYLLTENRVLREKLGKKRILPSDDQRRRLAVKGKILGRKMLEPLAAGEALYEPTLIPNRSERHPPGDGPLRDVGSQLQELAVHQGSAPQRKMLSFDRSRRNEIICGSWVGLACVPPSPW